MKINQFQNIKQYIPNYDTLIAEKKREIEQKKEGNRLCLIYLHLHNYTKAFLSKLYIQKKITEEKEKRLYSALRVKILVSVRLQQSGSSLPIRTKNKLSQSLIACGSLYKYSANTKSSEIMVRFFSELLHIHDLINAISKHIKKINLIAFVLKKQVEISRNNWKSLIAKWESKRNDLIRVYTEKGRKFHKTLREIQDITVEGRDKKLKKYYNSQKKKYVAKYRQWICARKIYLHEQAKALAIETKPTSLDVKLNVSNIETSNTSSKTRRKNSSRKLKEIRKIGKKEDARKLEDQKAFDKPPVFVFEPSFEQLGNMIMSFTNISGQKGHAQRVIYDIILYME